MDNFQFFGDFVVVDISNPDKISLKDTCSPLMLLKSTNSIL